MDSQRTESPGYAVSNRRFTGVRLLLIELMAILDLPWQLTSASSARRRLPTPAIS